MIALHRRPPRPMQAGATPASFDHVQLPAGIHLLKVGRLRGGGRHAARAAACC